MRTFIEQLFIKRRNGFRYICTFLKGWDLWTALAVTGVFFFYPPVEMVGSILIATVMMLILSYVLLIFAHLYHWTVLPKMPRMYLLSIRLRTWAVLTWILALCYISIMCWADISVLPFIFLYTYGTLQVASAIPEIYALSRLIAKRRLGMKDA